MLGYYLQKFLFQILIICGLLLFIGVFAFAVYTEQNTDEPVMFPGADTLGAPAPFADGQQAIFSTANLSEDELAELVTIVVSEALSFNASNFSQVQDQVYDYFMPSAFDQYQRFLESSKIYDALVQSNLEAKAFLSASPILQNALPQNGVFKWLVDVPVTISFRPMGVTDLTQEKPQEFNQKITLRLQITRLVDPKDPDRFAIEIWQVLPGNRF